MTPPSSACFLLALALLLYCHLPPADASVEETCEAAAGNDPNIHYDFCVKSLHENPGSCSADTKGLAIIAANLSYPRAAATKSKVKSLLQVATDRKAKQCLQTCLSTYSDLIPALTESISALEDDRLWDAKTYLSATTESPQDCEDGFEELRVSSPLSEENGEVGQLCTIALAITNMLG
ncbi:putative invertase inhibitor [Musa acuminata AAA Group]|uniref:putative invertase inhibitor n=1 Tax=Musa acuminata AAA Group TaxID=214697 RepID=UPI0031D4EDAF